MDNSTLQDRNEDSERYNKDNLDDIDQDQEDIDLRNNYKRKLILMVTGVFTVCVLIIIERIFNAKIEEAEAGWIASVQSSLNLLGRVDSEGFASFQKNFFFEFFGYLGIFEIGILILTHFFITLYVGIDGIVAIKMFFITLLCQFFIACLALLYEGPRPYWISPKIGTSQCIKTYGLPSSDVFLTLLLIFYTNFCFKKQAGSGNRTTVKEIIILTILVLAACGFFVIKWLIGQLFFCSMVIAVLYFVLVYYLLIFLDNQIHHVIRKSSIASYDSKKYVFYWFFWLILAELLACMFYNGSEDYLSIEWIQNYIYCEKSKGSLPEGVPYNELIGPWFTFLMTTSVFALVSGIFAIAHCFRHIGEFEWFAGSVGQRGIRILIANLSIMPSWVLIAFQRQIIQTEWVRLSGLNEFFFNGIHFFVLYFWLFGLMPLHVFKRFKLIPVGSGRNVHSQAQLSILQPSQ